MRRDWTEAIAKCREEGLCRYCSRGQPIDPAHIWPRSLGGSMDINNIVPLCRICHTRYDEGALDLLPCLNLDEQMQMVKEAGGIERARNRAIGRRRSQADEDTR